MPFGCSGGPVLAQTKGLGTSLAPTHPPTHPPNHPPTHPPPSNPQHLTPTTSFSSTFSTTYPSTHPPTQSNRLECRRHVKCRATRPRPPPYSPSPPHPEND